MESLLLRIEKLNKTYSLSQGFLSGSRSEIKAVHDLDLQLYKGETLGLVGESGCGKSTLGRLILKLEEPSSGAIYYEDESIVHLTGPALKNYRRKVQIVFQDPYASLNPRKTVGDAIAEPFIIHGAATEKPLEDYVIDMLEMVGLNKDHRHRYPHEFSGGQRQRIGIARALALRPQMIIADEPVSALDVSIQAQILNLLKDIQRDFQLTYLFITHDLSVVRFMSDRIAVMYLGKIVELAKNEDLYQHPVHPYTRLLLASIPHSAPGRKRKRLPPDNDLQMRVSRDTGCLFEPRCPDRLPICQREVPVFRASGMDHFAACHLSNK